MTVAEQITNITLTPEGAEAVKKLMEQKQLSGYALRLFIGGGGCSGYQPGLGLEQNVHPDDLVLEQHGVRLVVDNVSLQYLDGTTIEYIDDERGTGFKINNPNPLPSCSCSSSACASDAGGCGSN